VFIDLIDSREIEREEVDRQQQHQGIDQSTATAAATAARVRSVNSRERQIDR
jgi:hypothetical protein